MTHPDVRQPALIQTDIRPLRRLLLSVMCFVAWHCSASEVVLAQRRVPAKASVETPSQRLLPLPEGTSADLRQQVQWLQRLKVLLGAGGELPKLPPIDVEQMKLLREAMKQFGGGRSDGRQLPAFDGASLEQVSKALADPAMREQVRKALEQFQRDGQLPREDAASDSEAVPFPSRQFGQGKAGENVQPEQDRSSTGARKDSSDMPQALQELLKRLAPQTDRSSNGVLPERELTEDASTENQPEAGKRNFAKPNIPPMAPGGSQSNGRTSTNVRRPSGEDRLNTERSASEPSNPDHSNPVTRSAARPQTRSSEPNPRDERRMSERGPRMAESRTSPNREPRSPEMDQQPAAGSPREAVQSPGVTPPSGMSPHESSRDPNSTSPSAGRMPNSRPSTNDAASGAGMQRPAMDVRTELEQQGFARTLQKLVEQAREESLVAPSGALGASSGSGAAFDGQAGGGGSSAGQQSSMSRIVDGLRKDLIGAATENRSNPPSTSGRTDTARTTPPISSAIERPSTFNNVTQAANNLLSDIATAPAPRPAPIRSPGSISSGGMTVPQESDTRSLFGLLMLLAVLGLVWYFAPQLMAGIGESQRKSSLVVGVIHPADIRSRGDVVRAFHQFALRPATMAAEWWTHRAVEQRVAQETPSLQPAIQKLTDLYEQARYLPDDVDFTPDQIGTARQTLEQCEANQPRG